ncbi:MAG: TonB-dependent receptor [Gammaproteobacteria bacterium]|nr:TonB-dependent receptor [Gammaproteobacteria bacterium]
MITPINKFAKRCAGLGLGGTAALSLCGALPAYAQSDADLAGRDVITVTAEFRERSLQETPLAITAISAMELEKRSFEELSDISGNIPNTWLTESRGQQGGGMVAYMRGIGQYNLSPAYEPGVGVYIDDVYMATLQGALFNLIDLDRVEALRGPQGTLAGKNSIGGAIKLFSKKPQGDNSGYAQVTYGSFDRIQGRAAADFAISETLFARVNVAGRNEDGYVDIVDYGCEHPTSGLPIRGNPQRDCVVGTAENKSYVGGRFALRWMPSDRLEVNVTGDVTNDSSGPGADQLTGIPGPALVPASTLNGVGILDENFVTNGTYKTYGDWCNHELDYCNPFRGETDTWGFSGTIDWQFSDSISLKSITAYRAFESDITTDNDGTPITIGNHQIGMHGNQFSQEIRINANISDTLNLTVGGFYIDSDVDSDQRIDIQYLAFLGLVFFNDDKTPSKSTAGYAQLVWDPLDRLHLTGGLRYTSEKKDYTFFRTFADTLMPNPALYDLSAHYEGDRWDYRINASYDVTDDFMIYGQYATGFKGGGSNAQPFTPDQAGITFGAEKIGTWEAGFKYSGWDNRATFNIAAFYSNYTDIQLQALSCPPPAVVTFPCAAFLNVGSAHVKGAEAEVYLEPVDGFRVNAALSYLDFDYYESFTNVTLDMVPPYSAQWQWSLGAEYEMVLGNGMGTLTPRVDANYRSSIYISPVNGPNNLLPSRTLVNARIGWVSEDQDWEATLEITNLADKFFYNHWIDNSAFTGMTFGTPAEPRRWAFSVKRNF